MPALCCAPLTPRVLHLRSLRTQSQPFAHSWPGLEQDSALSFHPGLSPLDILRDTSMRHCHEAATRVRVTGTHCCRGTSCSSHSPQRKRAVQGHLRVPMLLAQKLALQKSVPSWPGSCLQLCTAFATPLQPVKTSQPPFPSSEVYWHSQHGSWHGWI